MSSRLITKCCLPPRHPPVRKTQESRERLCTFNSAWMPVTPSACGSLTTHLLDSTRGTITTNRIRAISIQQRCRASTITTTPSSIVSRVGSISLRLEPLSSFAMPLCHLRLHTPKYNRQIARHPALLPSQRVSIPSQGSSRRMHSTSASTSSSGSKLMTRRYSSSTAAAVSQSFPTGSVGSVVPEANSTGQSIWQFPHQTSGQSRLRSRQGKSYGPLPLPIALKALKPSPTVPSGATDTTQLKFPPPPAVLGSQPLYYLARRFPILAEQELKTIPNRTALDYSSFLIGAMSTSYPSATTLRAVVRQFKNFLKESSRRMKTRSGTLSASYMELPRARIWTQTIRSLIWLKQYRRARVAIHAMQKLGIKPTGYAWRGICRGWIEQGELDRAEALAVKVFRRPEISHDYRLEERPYYYTDMLPNTASSADTAARRTHRSPMSPNSAPLFLVIEALAECGEMERARHWFDQIPEHEMTDMLTSDMVGGYLRTGQQDKAQEVIRIMARCGVKPTAIVFNPIVEHAVKNVSMEAAEDLIQDMLKLGIFLNLYTFKILVRGYIAAGQRNKALECIDRIRASGIETDRAIGRILLEGFWQMGELRRGDHGPPAVCEVNRTQMMRDEMLMEELDFVGETGWSERCIEWIKCSRFELAEEALHQALDSEPANLDPDAVEVIKALAGQREMTRARHWFDRLLSSKCIREFRMHAAEQDIRTLVNLMNHMVSGYIQQRLPDEAEAVIGVMSQQGIQPTVETINFILQWSTLQAEMKDAEGLVQRMVQSGISPNQHTFEILCQGYASRGSLEALQKCLTRMEEAGCGGQGASQLLADLCENVLGQRSSLSETESPSPLQGKRTTLDTICARWIEQDQMSRAEEFVSHLVNNPNVQSNRIPYPTLIQGWINQSQINPVSSSAIQAITQSSRPGSSATTVAAESSTSVPSSSSVRSSKSLDQEFRLRQESVAKMRKARFWFDKIPEQERTLGLLNKMIGGYMALGLEHESEGLIQWMASRKIKPDVATYNHMLEHTIQRLAMPAAEGLLREMQKGGVHPNIETWNLMIRGYVIRGQLSKALQCLDLMAGKTPLMTSSVSTKSKNREVIESYDREIVDVVVGANEHDQRVHSGEVLPLQEQQVQQEQGQQQGRSNKISNESSISYVQPNETTEQLILSGFGPELKPAQGQGDYGRALELYRNRVDRQRQQKDQLMQGLAIVSQHHSLPLSALAKSNGGEGEADEDDWIFDQLETLQELGGLSDSDVGMTDLDWKNELKWEEMMEVEKNRERELSGR